MRTTLVNITRRSLTSSVSNSSSTTFNFPKIKETGFESQWRKLPEAERDEVEKDYVELGKKDWRQLTFDQMRARKKNINLSFINAGLVYTIAYGSPEVKDPNENRKVVFGVAALMLGSVGLFAFLRSFGIHYV